MNQLPQSPTTLHSNDAAPPTGPIPPPTPLQAQVSNLLNANQHRSAELLALMELSTLTSSATPSSLIVRAKTLEQLGEACTHQHRYTAAISYYCQAAELVHDNLSEVVDARPVIVGSSSSSHVRSKWEASLILKQCRVLHTTNSHQCAIDLLEQSFYAGRNSNKPTTAAFTNIEMHMLLGELYAKTRRKDEAVEQYKFALGLNPYLLEAVEKLCALGIDQEELIQVYNNGVSSTQQVEHGKGNDASNVVLFEQQPPPSQEIMESLRENALAHHTLHKNQLPASLHHFTKLHNSYPHHPYFTTQLANIQQEMGYILASEQNYQRVRSITGWVEGMDRYAHLLFQLRTSRKNAHVMNRGGYLHYHYSSYGERREHGSSSPGSIEETLGVLCTDMLKDDQRPEPWNILSLYHLTREDHEKALAFVDKAIMLDDEYAFSHLLRGSILLASHRPDHARLAFSKANDISRDVPSYEGLVESYLASGQYKEAVCSAKEAISGCPRDPRAITLVGLALAQAPTAKGEGRERAKRALKKALVLDTGALRPLFALVDLYAVDGEYGTCIKLLKDSIENGGKVSENVPVCSVSTWNKAHADVIHAKMAEIYTLYEDYGEALECYHTAIALNPQNGLAQQGMDRLEKLMSGIDPDEEEMGDDMHDDDDGEY